MSFGKDAALFLPSELRSGASFSVTTLYLASFFCPSDEEDILNCTCGTGVVWCFSDFLCLFFLPCLCLDFLCLRSCLPRFFDGLTELEGVSAEGVKGVSDGLVNFSTTFETVGDDFFTDVSVVLLGLFSTVFVVGFGSGVEGTLSLGAFSSDSGTLVSGLVSVATVAGLAEIEISKIVHTKEPLVNQ